MRIIDAGKESGVICMLIDVLGAMLEGDVLGVVVAGEDAIDILPLPSKAADLFEFFATVDWRRCKLEAQEHIVPS